MHLLCRWKLSVGPHICQASTRLQSHSSTFFSFSLPLSSLSHSFSLSPFLVFLLFACKYPGWPQSDSTANTSSWTWDPLAPASKISYLILYIKYGRWDWMETNNKLCIVKFSLSSISASHSASFIACSNFHLNTITSPGNVLLNRMISHFLPNIVVTS